MAAEPSHAFSLAWIWAIETLSSLDQIDASLLIDFVKRTPEISDHFGENARELVSFRILENLFVQKQGVKDGVASNPDSKVCFDPSERCEHVLLQIMNKSSRRMTEAERLKWDVQPFLQQKRSCLPKCSLQQLKAAILEDKLPLPTYLKERSGLVVPNQPETRMPMEDGNFNGNTERPEGSNINAQENSPTRKLLRAKRVRNDPATVHHGVLSNDNQIIMDDAYDLHSEAAKKLKQDAICTQQPVKGQNSIHASKKVEDVSGRAESDYNISEELQARDLEKVTSPEDGNGDNAASKRFRMNCDVDGADLLRNQQQAPEDGNGVNEAKEDGEGFAELRTSNCATQGVAQHENSIRKAQTEHSFQPNAPYSASLGKAKDGVEHNCESEMSGESDAYHDVRNAISFKKHAFLSSQCNYSQDSLATADGTNQKLCVKCKKGGQLLDCSSSACPIVVHQSCLGLSVTFDASGNFYCPFCAYSQAITEYMDVKKKTSLARKDLTDFIGFEVEEVEDRPKKLSKKFHGAEQNQIELDEVLDENTESNHAENIANRVNNSQSRGSTENVQQAGPSVSFINDGPPCGERGIVSTRRENRVSMEDKREAQKTGSSSQREQELQISVQAGNDSEVHIHQPNAVTNEEIHSFTEYKQEAQRMGSLEQVAVQTVQDCVDDNLSCRETKSTCGSEQQAGVVMPHEVSNGVSPRELLDRPPTDIDKSLGGKSPASNYSTRIPKREVKYTYPQVPLLRRKPVPWTKDEEETLKEGMKKLASDHDRGIPWKKILEFGVESFQKGRTAIDLKDKWRNICKGSPKSK